VSDHLDEDLRRVLRERTPVDGDGEALLRRVHTGAARRRTRRRVAIAAAAAGVTTIAVAVPLSLRGGPASTDDPVASQSPSVPASGPASGPAPRPGTPVEPTGVQVTAVSGVSESEFWVLGRGTCPSGECAVVGRAAPGGEPEFVAAPGTSDRAATLAMAVGGTDGWVVSGQTLYATHDGARSWDDVAVTEVTVPEEVTVLGRRVWVSGADRRGREAVATATIDSDTFVDAGLPVALRDRGTVDEPAATRSEAGTVYGFLRDQAVPTFAGTTDGAAWTTSPTVAQCRDTSSLSGADGALWAVCDTGSGFRPMVSADAGRSWEVVEVDIGPEPVIAAIDGERAAVSTGIALYVLNGTRLDIASAPDEGAGSRRSTYLGFTIGQVGYLVDDGGRLSRTENSGASWQLVELP